MIDIEDFLHRRGECGPESDLDTLHSLSEYWPESNQMSRDRLARLNEAVHAEDIGPDGSLYLDRMFRSPTLDAGEARTWLMLTTGGVWELRRAVRKLETTGFWRRRLLWSWSHGSYLLVV